MAYKNRFKDITTSQQQLIWGCSKRPRQAKKVVKVRPSKASFPFERVIGSDKLKEHTCIDLGSCQVKGSFLTV